MQDQSCCLSSQTTKNRKVYFYTHDQENYSMPKNEQFPTLGTKQVNQIILSCRHDMYPLSPYFDS